MSERQRVPPQGPPETICRAPGCHDGDGAWIVWAIGLPVAILIVGTLIALVTV